MISAFILSNFTLLSINNKCSTTLFYNVEYLAYFTRTQTAQRLCSATENTYTRVSMGLTVSRKTAKKFSC